MTQGPVKFLDGGVEMPVEAGLKLLSDKAKLAKALGEGWIISSKPEHYSSLISAIQNLIKLHERETTWVLRIGKWSRRLRKPWRMEAFFWGVWGTIIVQALIKAIGG